MTRIWRRIEKANLSLAYGPCKRLNLKRILRGMQRLNLLHLVRVKGGSGAAGEMLFQPVFARHPDFPRTGSVPCVEKMDANC